MPPLSCTTGRAPLPERSWREARVEDLQWTREHLIPWIGRRLTGRSSGDGLAGGSLTYGEMITARGLRDMAAVLA